MNIRSANRGISTYPVPPTGRGFHSEHGQDQWLEENVFKGQREGVFVELGALDGVYTSNTLFFEQERGWTGVLIEANPRMFVRLLDSGRTAKKVLAAVAEGYGVAKFLDVSGVPGWSGLLGMMHDKHKDRIADLVNRPPGGAYDVSVAPLSVILRKTLLTNRIDYFSLDVEGAELPVLKGLDFDEFDIRVLDVENNYGETQVDEFLTARGYTKIATVGGINDIYLRENGKPVLGYISTENQWPEPQPINDINARE